MRIVGLNGPWSYVMFSYVVLLGLFFFINSFKQMICLLSRAIRDGCFGGLLLLPTQTQHQNCENCAFQLFQPQNHYREVFKLLILRILKTKLQINVIVGFNDARLYFMFFVCCSAGVVLFPTPFETKNSIQNHQAYLGGGPLVMLWISRPLELTS